MAIVWKGAQLANKRSNTFRALKQNLKNLSRHIQIKEPLTAAPITRPLVSRSTHTLQSRKCYPITPRADGRNPAAHLAMLPSL